MIGGEPADRDIRAGPQEVVDESGEQRRARKDNRRQRRAAEDAGAGLEQPEADERRHAGEETDVAADCQEPAELGSAVPKFEPIASKHQQAICTST